MAFGPLFNGHMTGENGQDINVYVDREGYSKTNTTYNLRLKSDQLIIGQSGGELFAPTRRSRTATTFVGEGVPIEEAKVIPRRPYQSHRVRVEHGGSEVYRGYVDTDKTTTSISEQRGFFTIRARVGISSLNAEWVQPNGDQFTGRKKLSVILADIFDAIGLDNALDAVLAWRPAHMADTSDPLAIEAPAAAWQKTNRDGQTQAASRSDVLEDIAGMWLANVFLEDGTWRIRQPTAYRSGSTVTVHTYDSLGVYQGSVTEPATTDIQGDPWERDSDEVSGVTQLQSASVVYEHGGPNQLDLQGGFENGYVNAGWIVNDPSGNNEVQLVGSPYTYEGNQATEIEEFQLPPDSQQQYDPEDYKDEAKKSVEKNLGGWTPRGESLELVLRSRGRNNNKIAQIENSRIFWGLRIDPVVGDVHYWDEQNRQWTVPTTTPLVNFFQDKDLSRSYETERFTIPPPPLSGSLIIHLYNPVSQPLDSNQPTYTLFGYWDGCELNRGTQGDSETLYRATDPSVDGGDTFERTTQIGDGPYPESPGALRRPDGGFTGNWRIVGESTTYALHELRAKEVMASLRGGAQLIRSDFREPTRPQARRAVDFDSLRSWPVQVDRDTAEEVYSLALVQLRDAGHPPNFEIVAGGEGSFTSGGAGSPTDGASTWGDLSGKPNGLYARNAASDNIPETISVPVEVSSVKAGPVGANMLVFSHIARHGWRVQSLLLFAGTAPSSNYNFDVTVAGTSQTVTLPGSTQSGTYSIDRSMTPGDRLFVVSENTNDPDLADLHCSFDVLPA